MRRKTRVAIVAKERTEDVEIVGDEETRQVSRWGTASAVWRPTPATDLYFAKAILNTRDGGGICSLSWTAHLSTLE